MSQEGPHSRHHVVTNDAWHPQASPKSKHKFPKHRKGSGFAYQQAVENEPQHDCPHDAQINIRKQGVLIHHPLAFDHIRQINQTYGAMV